MSQKNVVAPRLPVAPREYSAEYMAQLVNILRLYFNQLDNGGPMVASTQRNGTTVISALSFIQPNPANPAVSVVSLPTDADFANLRSGDIYYDTSGGVATSYPLRIKA